MDDKKSEKTNERAREGETRFPDNVANHLNQITLDKKMLKWIVQPVYSIQDADEFVSSSEQIWRNVALHHLLTNGSSALNGCRQNESKQLIKTSQKSTSNPHDSSPLTLCESKSCVFIIIKFIIKSPLSILLLSPGKMLSRLNQKRNMHR